MERYVYIKTLTGKTITVPYTDSSTVHDIKVELQKSLGYPPYHQRLVMSGKHLLDGVKVIDYYYRDSKTVHAVLALRPFTYRTITIHNISKLDDSYQNVALKLMKVTC